MSDCLDSIVTIKSRCAPGDVGLSGYDLMDAPEISTKQAAAVANEDYVKGVTVLEEKLKLAVLDVKNDFLGLIHGNGFATSLSVPVYESGIFNPAIQNSFSNLERGLTIYPAGSSRKLSKLTISEISIYPLISGDSIPVKIYDNGSVYQYLFNLEANQVNTFPISHELSGAFARVVMSNSVITTASTQITCYVGCNGTVPNPCGYIKGYNGNGETAKEGFGINIKFSCECSYDQILCDIAKSYTGKLIWLKSRMHVMDEHLSSTRLNKIVIYGRDEIEKMRVKVEGEYVEYWNNLVKALPQLLRPYQGSCIDCKGIKMVTNI